MRIAITGVAGRMGVAVVQAAADATSARISGGWVRRGSAAEGKDLGLLAHSAKLGVLAVSDLDAALEGADAVIDFTLPEAIGEVVTYCRGHSVPLVTGTTGLSDEDQAQIVAAAGDIPIVQAANMSIGVTVLLDLAARATAALGPGFDAEIVESHHRHKRDAPSGTALAIGREVDRARGGDCPEDIGRGRDSGLRTAGAIGYSSVRAGEIVGEHTLLLAGPGERVELIHRAADRRAFAAGALRAAAWLAGRSPGLYGMRDVLNLGAPEPLA